MSSFRLDPRSPTPPSRQIVEEFLDRVAAGKLGVEAKLPSVRALAATALVNPNTVSKAYRELEGLGVVEGRSGAGVFVTAAGPRIARRDRRAATESAVRDAIAAARRTGHDIDAIVGWVEEALDVSALKENK